MIFSVQEHPLAGRTKALAAVLKTLWLFLRKENVKNLSGRSPSTRSWDGPKSPVLKVTVVRSRCLQTSSASCNQSCFKNATLTPTGGAVREIWWFWKLGLRALVRAGLCLDLKCCGESSQQDEGHQSHGLRCWKQRSESKAYTCAGGKKGTFCSKLMNLSPSFCYKTEAWRKARGSSALQSQ